MLMGIQYTGSVVRMFLCLKLGERIVHWRALDVAGKKWLGGCEMCKVRLQARTTFRTEETKKNGRLTYGDHISPYK